MDVSSPGARRPRAAAAAPTRPQRQRLSGDMRRAQIAKVALRLFASRGFGGTTTKAIADAAGLSEGAIFRHFATKDDLYAAILQDRVQHHTFTTALDDLRAACATGDDRRVIRQAIALTLNAYRRHPDFHRMMLFAALEGVDLARASQRVIGTPLFTLFCDYVRARQAAGVFRPGPPELLVFGLLAPPAHFGMATTLFGRLKVAASDDEILETFTAMVLDGLRGAPPRQTSARPSARRARRRGATSRKPASES